MADDPFAAMAADWQRMLSIYQGAWSEALGYGLAEPEAAAGTLKAAYERMAEMTREAEAAAAAAVAGPPLLAVELASAGERIEAIAGRLTALEQVLRGLTAAAGAGEPAGALARGKPKKLKQGKGGKKRKS
jgi:hypothetical protein